MAQLRINANIDYTIDVTVRETDEITRAAFVRFDRNYLEEGVHGCNEFFLTPTQLEQLGRFLVRQADEIRTAQQFREVA